MNIFTIATLIYMSLSIYEHHNLKNKEFYLILNNT